MDLAILDYRQCFDTMSVDITTNDMYEVGVTNDHLNLIYEGDKKSKIAVKTPMGVTERVDLNKVVAQGEIISPLKCSITVDSIACDHVENLADHLYHYKDSVPIPPLGMVDDTIGISYCGLDSVLTTAHLNSKTNIKKHQYGQDKCHKLHIGKNINICPDNSIDTWSMEKHSENISSVLEMVDKEGDKHILEAVTSDKYLGDIISSDGKNTLNIQERKRRGYLAVNQINEMLNDLCLGKYYFEAGNILRNSLLLSSLLSNSESWYNITNKELSELESVDEALLRKILSAHSKTPLELLYLETGSIPVRFIVMARRLNFLWYILNESEDSLIRNCLSAQIENPSKGDWILTIKEDLKELKINLGIEEIANSSKEGFKQIVKSAVKEVALEFLLRLKATHSKGSELEYDSLQIQPYLKADSVTPLTIDEKQFIFAVRSRMLDIKGNYKFGQSNLLCRACHQAEENQEHLLECSELKNNEVVINSFNYIDIFGSDEIKISEISKIIRQKLKRLQTIVNTSNGSSATV